MVKDDFKGMYELEVDLVPGSDIKDVCEKMYHLAMGSGTRVKSRFNGVEITFDPSPSE